MISVETGTVGLDFAAVMARVNGHVEMVGIADVVNYCSLKQQTLYFVRLNNI